MVLKFKALIKNHAAIRYVLVGGLSYLIELSVLLGLYKLVGLSAELSTALAFWVGLASSFVLQKMIAFRDYTKTAKLLSRQLLSYGLLVTVNYIFTLAVVALFPSRWIIFSRTLALIITTGWNFVIYKRIFRNGGTPSKSDKIAKHKLAARLSVSSRSIALFILLSAPVVIFFYQYLASGNKILVGDFDYVAQMYEAFRISVVHYHQLPLWNPWISGGVPLFANPQFGLFSIQSLFTLIFGVLIGLKLAYIVYALAGFWGMYKLSRNVIGAGQFRSLVVSYIWVFCGFFAGHNISHYTFASFFLLPWLIYFIARRKQAKSWLWFGFVESVIILSSMHYAFLMLAVVAITFFILSLIQIMKKGFPLRLNLERSDWTFIYRSIPLILIVCGYRMLTTYYFVAHNQRPASLVNEPATPVGILLKAIFLPIGTLLSLPKTKWGWGEYSMYIGLGAAVSFGVILTSLIRSSLIKKRVDIKTGFVAPLMIVGLLAFCFAIGDFAKFSPYNILHHLPGFSQTRVPARWQIVTVFSLLVLLAAWSKQRRLINLLLALAAIELFFSYGPPRINGSNEIKLPATYFSSAFRQYDNGRKHLDAARNPMHFYYYTTEQNIGQIYSDDSIVDTLDGVLNTSRCGYNDHPSCGLIISHNALLTYWSPNSINLKRTAPGPIELNMNVDAGWRVNDVYPYASMKALDPKNHFVLPGSGKVYRLTYAPKFSPSWLKWRLGRI